MSIQQYTLEYHDLLRGLVNITKDIAGFVKAIDKGLLNIFLHHTSASLILCENSDPAVQHDLEAFMQKIAPDSTTLYRHIDEGADDMPAHIRTILTQNSLVIPIEKGHLKLGTWQGIFLWEHRFKSDLRRITLTIMN